MDALAEQLRRFLPRSKYSSSMHGLSWKQVFDTPLPPYLSFLPVLFRVLCERESDVHSSMQSLTVLLPSCQPTSLSLPYSSSSYSTLVGT